MLDKISFREEIQQLFRQMPVMTGPQFVRSVNLISGYEGDELMGLIDLYTKNGIVLVSQNELVTAKFTIEKVCEGQPQIQKRGMTRVEVFTPKPFFTACMDLYALILDMYPYSRRFRLAEDLFQVSFVHASRNLIYELVRVPRNKDQLYRAMFLKDGFRYEGTKFESVRAAMRRIALVESPACAEIVPYTGFNLICVADAASPKGFRVLEKRTGNVWRDIAPDDQGICEAAHIPRQTEK